MKVHASVYYPTPGAIAAMEEYPSIAAVEAEVREMAESADRFGGPMPEASVFHPECHDYPMLLIEVGPRGGIRRVSSV